MKLQYLEKNLRLIKLEATRNNHYIDTFVFLFNFVSNYFWLSGYDLNANFEWFKLSFTM